jgi:hypothetical protein
MNEETSIKPQSSVEFSMNTKGFVTYTIKVYNDNPDFAMQKAQELSNSAKLYCNTQNNQG